MIEFVRITQSHMSRIELIRNSMGVSESRPSPALEIQQFFRAIFQSIELSRDLRGQHSKLNHLTRVIMAQGPTPRKQRFE